VSVAAQLMAAWFGRQFVVPGRWSWRWNWQMPLHRLVHRDPQKACFVCTAVWRYLETVPGFSEGIRAGEEDIKAGRTRPWSEVRNGPR